MPDSPGMWAGTDGTRSAAREFRWRVTDDLLGDDWTDWHTTTGPCSACCCGGPRDGVHQHGTMDHDEGFLTKTHRWLDPADPADCDQVEFRAAPDA
jgi:hypothetical protein